MLGIEDFGEMHGRLKSEFARDSGRLRLLCVNINSGFVALVMVVTEVSHDHLVESVTVPELGV